MGIVKKLAQTEDGAYLRCNAMVASFKPRCFRRAAERAAKRYSSDLSDRELVDTLGLLISVVVINANCSEQRERGCIAVAAVDIWGMCLTTGRNPLENATV